MAETRKCMICGTDFEPKRSDSRMCSKKCLDRYYRERNKENKQKNPAPRARISKPGTAQVGEGILLESQLIKAVKRSVAQEIIKTIEERYM